ncbi:M56 family metallopeptidase [Saccharobesus litoralis]|nr:M56 family metallopeptidase [Saccharobesus litoralis]
MVLLLGHKWLIRTLGAINTYLLWLTVPLGLVIYCLPLPWQQSNVLQITEIKRYLVDADTSFQQSISMSWFVYIWLGVAVAITAYWLLSYFTFNKQLQLIPVDKSILPVTLPKKLSVYQHSKEYSPMLVGMVQPKLIIPENFFELYSVEQQKLILEHEICHFDRNDIYWNLVAITCLTLFWFHPLAWLSYFRFRQDQELSCDQLVVARKPKESRITYSKALLVTAQSTPPLAFAQLSFTKYGDKQMMFERINNVKTSTKASKSILATVMFATITMLSGLSYAGNQHDKAGAQIAHKNNLMAEVRIKPKYPLQAAQNKTEGSVVLKFDVTASGAVQNVEVVNAKPAYVFDKAAVTALKQWKYSAPGRLVKNNLVQLDFAMNDNTHHDNLIEQLKVTN